jgi:ABC-type branched-subunit amino acid transport system substrate-binding protein
MLYGTGSYATEAFLGAQYAASTFGLKLVSQQLAATDTDMSGAISSFKAAGAQDVVMVALAPQDFNAISAAQAANYTPTWVAASFLASALTTSIAPVLESNKFLVMGNGGNVDTADLSSNAPGVRLAIAAYKHFFHTAPVNPAVLYGYAQALVLEQIIAKACGKGNTLSRGALVQALAKIKTLTTQGLLPPLNYSVHEVNVPPTTEIYLSSVNTKVLGSLKAATGYFQAPQAKGLNLNGN